MKRNDITALHDKGIDALEEQLLQLQQELAKARIEKAAGKLANVSSVKMLKHDIARVKTVLHEKTVVAAEAAAIAQAAPTASATSTTKVTE
ncbi:MAG: 50S ribosomal protein L29 [Patescibacteria group bacterium]